VGRHVLFEARRRVSFILSEQDCVALEQIATHQGDSMTSVMRRFVRAGINSVYPSVSVPRGKTTRELLHGD
jgi:hypothetical protein